MNPPEGLVDPNPPVGGYRETDSIMVEPPYPFPRYVLRCPSEYGDPQWLYEGND